MPDATVPLSGLEQLQAWLAAGKRPPIGDSLQFELEVQEDASCFAVFSVCIE